MGSRILKIKLEILSYLSIQTKLNCEHTMQMVFYENTNKLTVMVDDEEIIYYNSEELLNR